MNDHLAGESPNLAIAKMHTYVVIIVIIIITGKNEKFDKCLQFITVRWKLFYSSYVKQRILFYCRSRGRLCLCLVASSFPCLDKNEIFPDLLFSFIFFLLLRIILSLLILRLSF